MFVPRGSRIVGNVLFVICVSIRKKLPVAINRATYELIRFFYLKTKDDAETDLVVERPGRPLLFIEIKSTDNVLPSHLTTLKSLVNDFGVCEAICISCDPYAKHIDGIMVLPWAQAITSYFGPHLN